MLFIGLLDQWHARAARHMVHPHLAGAERATGGEMLLGDEERAAGRPARLIEPAEILPPDPALVAAVAVNQPDIVAARAVGAGSTARAVGPGVGLMLKGGTLGELRRFGGRRGGKRK